MLESSDDSELIEQCLEGLKKAVRIAGGLDMTASFLILFLAFFIFWAKVFTYFSRKIGQDLDLISFWSFRRVCTEGEF